METRLAMRLMRQCIVYLFIEALVFERWLVTTRGARLARVGRGAGAGAIESHIIVCYCTVQCCIVQQI